MEKFIEVNISFHRKEKKLLNTRYIKDISQSTGSGCNSWITLSDDSLVGVDDRYEDLVRELTLNVGYLKS